MYARKSGREGETLASSTRAASASAASASPASSGSAAPKRAASAGSSSGSVIRGVSNDAQASAITRVRSPRTPSRSASAGRSTCSCCGPGPIRAVSCPSVLRRLILRVRQPCQSSYGSCSQGGSALSLPCASVLIRLVLPVLQRLADVLGHQARGQLAVLRADRGRDRAVLGDIRLAPLRAGGPRGQQAAADLHDPQRRE